MTQKIFFENSKGNKLVGILSNASYDKTKPIIVLCHGFSASKQSTTYLRFEEILNSKQISTLRFDFYGHGESDGKFEDITISEAVDDTLQAINFVKNLGYTKIGLFGSSFGGIASIMAASNSKDIFVLALKSPVSNDMEKMLAERRTQGPEAWKKKGYLNYTNATSGEKLRLNYSFYVDAQHINGYKVAKKIEVPTIIVHGDEDKIVPIEQSIKTASIIKDCRLDVIKGANHFYSKPEDFEKMLELISEFIFEHC